MEGFFDTKEIQSDHFKKGKHLSCVSCGLYKHVLSPKIKPYGDFKKKVMVIEEAPGKNEDRRGKPWQGKMGNKLKRKLRHLGFDLFKDAVSLNSCQCRPPKNATPDTHQIDCCRTKVQQAIHEYKPKVIILLGNCAIESVIGKYWLKDLGGITKWRGWTIPDQNYKAWIVPTYHPSFIDRQKEPEIVNLLWKQDLQKAIDCIEKPMPVMPVFEDRIVYCYSDREHIKAMQEVAKSKYFAFDYETTGLRPYRKGHKIVCTSAAIKDKSFVWENTPERNKTFSRILRDMRIKKSSHNVFFEDMWSSHFISKVNGWDWCSQNTAHILDNRHGITGLKFQTYIHFGIADYDGDVSYYLKSVDQKKHGANSFNRIEHFIQKFGIKKLLTYCGLDSLFGYKLTMIQKEMIENDSNN